MSLQTRLKRLEQRQPTGSFRPVVILDDLISPDNLEEDDGILGLTEMCWGEPQGKVWMRKKGESLNQLRVRVGRDASCLEGELCLFDAVRSRSTA